MSSTEKLEKTLFEELKDREKIIVSSMLFDAETKEWAINKEIPDKVFLTDSLRVIVQAFNAIASLGFPVTDSLLADRIAPKSADDRSKFLMFIKRLRDTVPPEPKDAVEAHLEVLKKAYKIRMYSKMFEKGAELAKKQELATLSDDMQELERHVETSLFDIAEETSVSEIKSMDILEGYHHLVENMKTALTSESDERVTSGYLEIDKVLNGGFLKGTFAIVAARPAMGKTVMMLNMAVEAALAGKKVLFVSIEMNLLQCFQRLIAKISNIPSDKLQQPEFMTPSDWRRLEEAGKEIVDLYADKFWIDEVETISVPQLERRIKYYKKNHDVDIVYVDYAQIMLTKDGNEPSEASDYAQISGGLRRSSKALNVAIVVGSQITRGVDGRADKRPMMSDIRNSGAFEQDAAVIMGLYRDEVYNKETTTKPNTLEVIFLKNRFGEGNGTIDFTYDLKRQSIMSEVSSSE